MFDTVAGLPVHVLVVHAVVVGVPLMALVTVAVAVRRPPSPWLWLVVAANAALVVTTLVAKLSGEELEERVGGQDVVQHSALGDVLPWFVVGLVVASVLVALASARPAIGRVALVVSLVAAVAATVWVVRVGDSGARAVWEQRIGTTDS